MINFINTLFLVFSCGALGFYAGYLLFFRDRSNDDKRLRELARENENARHTLQLAQKSHAKLNTQFTRQTGQLKTLQTLCDDWTESRRQADQERGELEEALRAKSQRLTELQSDLTAEKQSRIDLEDTQHRLHQDFTANLANVDETWRKSQAKAEAAFGKIETQNASITKDKSQLEEKLKAAEIQVAKMQAELANQQVLLATATNNAQGLEQEYISVESSLADNNQQLQSAIAQCAAAESAKQAVESSLANLRQECKQLQTDNERLVEQIIELEALQPQINSLNETVQAAGERLTAVVAQRDQALTAEAAAKNVSSGLQQRIDNQETTIHRLRTKYEQSMEDLKLELSRRAEAESELQESLAVASERQTTAMIQLTNQRDHFSDQLKAAESQMASLLTNHQQKIDSLVVESNGLESKYTTVCQESETLAKQCEELTELCDEQAALINKLRNEQGDYTNQITRLGGERDKLANRIAILSGDHDELTSQFATLTSERGEFATQIASLAGEQKTLVNQVGGLTNERDQLSNKIADLTSQYDGFTNQIASLTSERDGLLARLDQAEERLGVGIVELKSARSKVTELESETEELKISCQRISELEALVQSRDANQDETTHQLEQLRTAYNQASSNNESLQSEIDRLQADWAEQLNTTSRNSEQLHTLQTKLRASEETIRSLRKERAAVLARLANYRTIAEPEAKVISFTEAMEIRDKRDTDYDHEYGGPVRMHATRGLIYTQPPKEYDDLKRISGIAVVLEARLNDYGVYTFKQIMEWKPEAIEEFSHLLTFKDRIERDDWISQAKFFYNEKQRVGQTYAA